MNPNSIFACDHSFAVIVNSSVDVTSVDKDKLKQIYLGNTLNWGTGSKIMTSRLSEKDCSVEIFVKEIMEVSIFEYISFWRKKLFSGRAIPPRVFETTNEVIQFVSSQTHSIGIISKQELQDLPKNVKKIEF